MSKMKLTRKLREATIAMALLCSMLNGLAIQQVSAIGSTDLSSLSNRSELYDPNTCIPGAVPDTTTDSSSGTPSASSTSPCCPTSDTSSGDPSTLSGSTNGQKVYNYFTGQGLSPVAASAIIGNWQQESSLQTVDPSSGHDGIAQWGGSRLTGLHSYAASKGKSWTDLLTQLNYAWQELNGSYKPVLDALQHDTDPAQLTAAVQVFELKYEICASSEADAEAGCAESKRISAAHDALLTYGSGLPGPAGANPVTSSDTGGSCGGCDTVTSADSSTIVLDPGHSPQTDPSQRDPATGLYVEDYENDPEMDNAYTAATKIESKLKAKGYNVVLTKNSADDKLDLGTRAQRANAAHGALVVTLHSDPGIGSGFLMYPDTNSQREPGTGPRTDGTNGLIHPEIEKPSEQAAKAMATVIAGEGESGYVAKSFQDEYGADGLTGNGLNKGNTPVETILMSTPEVYSEVPQNVLPSDRFATAMTDAIEKAAPLDLTGGATSGASVGTCATGTTQAAIQTAIQYAWPDGPHGSSQEPAYKQAIAKAQGNGWYIGGGDTPGNDCGGFVTTVMRSSGADPNYNPAKGPTSVQEDYLQNSGKYMALGPQNSTSNLQPGDIAVSPNHTFIYVGHQPGFSGNSASASIPDRAPNADNAYFTDYLGVPFKWFRLKGTS